MGGNSLSAPSESGEGKSLKFLGRAFSHRNYRLFFAGQGVSLIGTWMQQIAMSWLVYRLTDSAFLLSLVSFTGSIPMFLFASFAGTFVDRWDRHRLLLVAQVFAMIQAALLTFLTLSGLVAVWHIFVLSFFLGLINAFDMPTRHAFVIDMVEDKADLSNAIALNSAMFNGARLVGPSLAGLTVAAFGEGICFLFNTLSFAAIIMALLAMHMQRKTTKRATTRVFEGLKEGYRYAFGFLPIRYLLLVLVVLNFMGMQYVVLMPVFARDVLHGGAHTQGFLVAASGVGALVSAVYLASRKSVVGLEKVAFRSLGLFGCAIMAFSFSRNVYLSLALMVVAGTVMMAVLISCNTIIQTLVDEDKRGRVMSLHAMSTIGTMPFGSLMVGAVASYVGAPRAVFIASGCCIAASLIFYLKLPRMRSLIRPIYVARGIVPEPPQ
jgi:MFS family permease